MVVMVLKSASPFLPLPHADNIQVAYGQGFQNIVQGELTKPAINATSSDNATSTLSFPALADGGEEVGNYAIVNSDNHIVTTVTMDVPVTAQGNVYELVSRRHNWSLSQSWNTHARQFWNESRIGVNH